MRVVVFEDHLVDRLYPITVGRPAYAIACGSFRLIDWIDQLQQPIRAVVRPHLQGLQAVDFAELSSADSEARSDPGVLVVNARTIPSRPAFDTLRQLLTSTDAAIVRYEGEVAALRLSSETTIDFAQPHQVTIDGMAVADYVQSSAVADVPIADVDLPLFQYPHDVVRQHMEILAGNLEYRLQSGQYEQQQDGVFLAAGARLGEYMSVDTSEGPIILDRNARIGPHCYLSGPAYLGPNSRINEHSAIKDGVALGHTTKIGGEVEASIIEPYSNKQHHGFLGHSYLGSWINLGAGTCNSDLKNTYGTVNMEYRGVKVGTGMQFVGCVMGDYAKTAINTGIFTGKTIGACSMLYGFVTTNVPSFVNYARLFGQVTEIPAEVMVATQRRMFQRRNVEPRDCDQQLIHDMFQLTREERQIAGEPLAL